MMLMLMLLYTGEKVKVAILTISFPYSLSVPASEELVVIQPAIPPPIFSPCILPSFEKNRSFGLMSIHTCHTSGLLSFRETFV